MLPCCLTAERDRPAGGRLLLTCIVLLAAQVHTAALLSYKGCSFGTLPGRWNRSAGLGSRWLPMSQQGNCSQWELLLPKLQQYEHKRFITMVTGSALKDPRSRVILRYSKTPPKWQMKPTNMFKKAHPAILFLGDHHDRWLVLDACQALRGMKAGTMQHCPRYPDLSRDTDADETQHRYMYFSVCENGAASLAMRYVPGVSPTGPYYKQSKLEGVASSNASWAHRTQETLSLFSSYFKKDPDMVVVHANYWDLMNMKVRGEPHVQHLDQGLPQEVLQQWSDNMTAWIRHIRTSVPYDTLVMLRTTALPKTDAQGVPYLSQLPSVVPIKQINMAARALAQRLNVTLLDCELQLQGMQPKDVLRDNSNPSNWVNLEWMNTIFNVLKQHKPWQFAHVSPVPGRWTASKK